MASLLQKKILVMNHKEYIQYRSHGERNSPNKLDFWGKKRKNLHWQLQYLPAQEWGSLLFPSASHPWRLLALEYMEMPSPFAMTFPMAIEASRRTGRRAPNTSNEWSASSHFLCHCKMDSCNKEHENQERVHAVSKPTEILWKSKDQGEWGPPWTNRSSIKSINETHQGFPRSCLWAFYENQDMTIKTRIKTSM